MNMRIKTFAAICAAAFTVLLSASAQANSILLDNTVTPNPSITAVGSNYNWAYTILVTPSSYVATGDFFTIIDFAGYVGGISQPSGWTLTIVNSISPVNGDPGYSSSAPDDTNIPDLVWTYTGVTDVTGSVGTFVAQSIYGTNAQGSLLAVNHGATTINGVTQIQRVTNDDSLLVPVASVPTPAAVWSGFALFGLLGLRGLYRRRQQQ
jgi:hypothetical protein